MSEITLIKNTSEIAAGTRGSSLGFDAVAIAALNKEYTFFQKYPIKIIEDENHFLYKENHNQWAKNIRGVIKIYEKTAKVVTQVLEQNNFPLVIAGDHASAGGTLAGIKKAFPHKTIGAIWIDAHADLHTPYTTPSGNMHGMPLAVSLGEDNLDCQVRKIDKVTLDYWERLKNIGGIQPKITPDNVVFFAVRSTEKPEDYLRAKYQIKNFLVDEIREKGVTQCIDETLEILQNCDCIYISYDVDSMDCDLVSKGTGTPVKDGITPTESQQIISQLIESGKVCCLEVVEVNPLLDNKCNVMAETAADILNHVIPKIKVEIEKQYSLEK